MKVQNIYFAFGLNFDFIAKIYLSFIYLKVISAKLKAFSLEFFEINQYFI